MIPILYDKNEISFTNNGICRLRDCISAIVVEERNGIYELDIDYPVNGANYEQIECGRIVGVTHDEDGDLQPFEIVSVSRPIDGIVSFHCVHISYRQSQMTVSGTNINSLADAFNLLKTAKPSNPFTYEADFTSTGYMASADGTPRTVRQMLGGVRGSILDAYGGEYEWDKYTVRLHHARGETKDFAIRYGVNLLGYNDDTDYQGTYTSCVAFWKSAEGEVVTAEATLSEYGYNDNDICIPLDLSDKFEEAPTVTALQAAALSYMRKNNANAPVQSINVDFVRLSELGEFAEFQDLLTCRLCDSIKVVFPQYGVSAFFKIVRTEWDVLADRYIGMELGTLRTTLAEALGIVSESSLPGEGTALTIAREAKEQATDASSTASEASQQATSAATSASEAKAQALAATTSANEAKQQASDAAAAANTAQQLATQAGQSAAAAQSSADEALRQAGIATTNASTAIEQAGIATTNANTAKDQAGIATTNANEAIRQAGIATTNASTAIEQAGIATTNASEAIRQAGVATTNANEAIRQAGIAKSSADDAMASAVSATNSANSALTQLSTVEEVVDVLNWITEHGTYKASTDTEVVAGKFYFTRTGSGTTADPYVYTVVTNPTGNPSTSGYYELDSVDEAISNYVSTHLALTSEGLYVLKDNSGWKVLITNNGVYIQNPSGTTVATYSATTTIGSALLKNVYIDSNGMYVRNGSTNLASFTDSSAQIGQSSASHSVVDANGMRIFATDGSTQIANLGYGEGNVESGTAIAPYYTFGSRNTNRLNNYNSSYTYNPGDYCKYDDEAYVCIYKISVPEAWNPNHWEKAIGGFSLAQGQQVFASGYCSVAEGINTVACGSQSHAEGLYTVAASSAHAEGSYSKARASCAHAQNLYTIADYPNQTAIGKYNSNVSTNAFEIGNGINDSNRSNALTVDWNGNVNIASGAKYKINGSDLSASDIADSVTGVKGNSESSYRTGNVNLTPANIGAVPTTRTVNSKALSSNITLTASDVSAVPTTRKVNNKALSSDITLSASDVSAVPTTRTVNSKALSANITLSASDVGALPLSGGTMTGQIKTSFKESVAMGSYGATASTVDGLVSELRFSSGCMGSASISTAYTKGSVTIGTGWYNFIYSPHRSGGANGAASGDNCNYGNLLLMGMTAGGAYLIRVASAAIQEVKILGSDYVRATFTPTSGSSYSSYGGCYYEKYGRVVHVHAGVSGLSTGVSTKIYTLPSGYRPTSPVFAHGTGGSWNNIGYMEISTAGVVTVRSQGTYCGADVTFMV